MKACIVCNGEIDDYDWAASRIRDCDLLIAADGGANHLEKIGAVPHVIVGDMDSVEPTALENGKTAEQISFPEDKDKTDAELAIELALERGSESIILLGATGGRLDHTLGNICLAAKYPRRVTLATENTNLTAVNNSQPGRITGKPGSLVSLIPFPAAEKVMTTGLKYSLAQENLPLGTRGISNVLSHSQGTVSVSRGLLLVIIEHRRG